MLEEQSFSYEKTEGGVRILRCYGVSSKVEVPSELDGLPVTELSDYAFARETEEEAEHTSGLPCVCGLALEELSLPETIRRLGRYVFYNCTRLRKLSFYSNIAFMGAGGFVGCENLTHLLLQQKEGKSCLREILQDLKQSVAVDCYREGVFECRLVYPEFFEEAVENTPARIINTQTHGMGIQYRNTFRDTRIVFSEYDKLFETGKYNIDLTSIIEMAAARLMYPFQLEKSAEGQYGQWFRHHWVEAAEYFLEQEKTKELRWMAESFAETREEVELLLQAADARKDAQELSGLMDILHRRFPGKRKKFAL